MVMKNNPKITENIGKPKLPEVKEFKEMCNMLQKLSTATCFENKNSKLKSQMASTQEPSHCLNGKTKLSLSLK